MNALVSIAFQIAKRRVRKAGTALPGRASQADYVEWRGGGVERFRDAFDDELIRGKDVLDFGCGTGNLSKLLVNMGARSCIGMDLAANDIATARSRLTGSEPIRFEVAADDTRIDLPEESVDVIACYDVMEHILKYREIMREWRRVLRPGGHVLILWQPYFHPYGHHGQDYIPIPWAHVLLSHRQQRQVAERIVDLPEFAAPYWDHVDGARINRFRDELASERADSSGHLNELTMARFGQVCHDAGLSIERRTLEPFRGPWPIPAVSALLTRIPWVREFFTANAIYVLRKNTNDNLRRS